MSAVDNANDCCSGNEILVTRVLLFNPAQKQNIDYIRGTKTLTQEITDYKALSRKFGNTRRTLKFEGFFSKKDKKMI